MLSPNLQSLYNSWMISSRKAKNEPFRIRKNFDNFKESDKAILERLDAFFLKFPSIQKETFFISPYKVFPGEKDFYPLDFYLTHRAVSCYTTYIKQQEMEDPDSEDSMTRFKSSLKFIFLFCKKECLTLEEYVTYSRPSEAIPMIIQHLKNHDINFYALHSLSFSVPKDDKDIYDFMIPKFSDIFYKTRTKYFHSKKMKPFSKKAIQAFEEKINLETRVRD